MFTDKLTLAIAEAAKKCMDEELKGNQHKIDANKNDKIDAHDFKILRGKKEVKEELKGNQHKIDANKNGKIDAQDFKILRKEETVNEEEGKHGYVAFSHNGQRHELYANSSYEAKQKAVKHFNPPKSKQHLVTVHLAQKDGKDVVHTATESVQEAAIDDLRDRQAAAREANPYGSTAKKQPVARKVQGSQYGGSKQKHEPEKEVDESVQIEESKAHIEQHLADRDINAKVTGNVVKVHSSDVASAKKHVKMAGYKDHKVVGGLNEEKMSDEDMAERERIVKGMKKNLKGFKQRYGERAKEVMYATATKQAMKEEEQLDEISKSTLDSYIHKSFAAGNELHKQIEKETDPVKKAELRAKLSKRNTGVIASAKKLRGEEVEQLDEISKKTLGSYVKKASADIAKREVRIDRALDSSGSNYNEPSMQKALNKNVKRVAGLNKATDKLAKEEVEQIDEISKNTLGSYIKKAAYNAQVHAMASKDIENKEGKYTPDSLRHDFKRTNRRAGIVKAVNRLTKEEVTNDGFKAELEDNKAKAAGTKKQADVAKAAVQSVKQESFSAKLSSLKEGVRSFLKGNKDE